MGCTATIPTIAKGRCPHSTAGDIVLVVSATPGESAFLRQVLNTAGCTVRTVHAYREALALLASQPVSVILAEARLADGEWEDILNAISVSGCAPELIVTSEIADERLWMTALNLGAYDVIAKPFETREVSRIVALALDAHRRRI